MPPLHRDHVVIGAFTLKGSKLTFRTTGALLARAMLFFTLHHAAHIEPLRPFGLGA